MAVCYGEGVGGGMGRRRKWRRSNGGGDSTRGVGRVGCGQSRVFHKATPGASASASASAASSSSSWREDGGQMRGLWRTEVKTAARRAAVCAARRNDELIARRQFAAFQMRAIGFRMTKGLSFGHRIVLRSATTEGDDMAVEETGDSTDPADIENNGTTIDLEQGSDFDAETEVAVETASESETVSDSEVEIEDKSISVMLSDLAAKYESEEGDLGGELGSLAEATQLLENKLKDAEAACLEVNLTLSNTKESYLRLNADFDNFRKRTIREKEELATKGRGDVLEEFLPLVDNFEMAAKSLKLETEGEEKINESYQGLYKQMIEIMRKAGLSVVDSVGKEFNPEVHDAIMREPTDEHKDGTVIEEFRRGFVFGERLLRPAMVKVAVAVEPAEVSTETKAEEDTSEKQEGIEGDENTGASQEATEGEVESATSSA